MSDNLPKSDLYDTNGSKMNSYDSDIKFLQNEVELLQYDTLKELTILDRKIEDLEEELDQIRSLLKVPKNHVWVDTDHQDKDMWPDGSDFFDIRKKGE